MQTDVARPRVHSTIFLLLLAATICAACNLNFAPVDETAAFAEPPAIFIAAPLPNQTFLVGATVMVQARVENAGPDLARVSVLLDDALLGEKLNPNETNAAVLPLTIDWPTSIPGQYKITVVAERASGASAREEVSILVIARTVADVPVAPTDEPQAAATEQTAESLDSTSQPTAVSDTPADQAPATTAPATEAAPASIGESQVAGVVLDPANLRSGPGTAFVPPVGSLPSGQAVTIVAVNPARDWFRITYADLGDAWIYSDLVQPAGVLSGVPVETGPAAPTQEGVNLVVASVMISPNPPTCLEPASVKALIQNTGTVKANHAGILKTEAVLERDGQILNEDDDPVPSQTSIDAGAEVELQIPITLSAHFGQAQRIRVSVDIGSQILEIDETDNSGTSSLFELQKGNCA